MLKQMPLIGLALLLCSCGGGPKLNPNAIVGNWRFDPAKSKNYISYLKDGPKSSADYQLVDSTYKVLNGMGFDISESTWSSGVGKEFSEPVKYEVASTTSETVIIRILEGEKKGKELTYFVEGEHLVVEKGTVAALFFSKVPYSASKKP